MGRATTAIIAAGLLAASLATPVAAADFAEFGTPTASGSFGEPIEFRQPATFDRAIERAELLVTIGDDLGPTVFPVVFASGPGPLELSYTVPDVGHILPNTPMVARWRVVSAGEGESAGAAEIALSPEVRFQYVDDRFDWKTASGDIVRVHWYEGGDAFGQRALAIGEDGVDQAASLLGVRETEPVDFFIYADQDAFYDALGPGTRENVGGQADAEIRTLFALITPSEIDDDWVETVIPHELTHLVFDTAVDNPYHFPPRWLNEGLAVYESEGYGPGDRNAVEDAARDGTLIPLPGLSGQFPTSGEQFRLAYAESVSSIDFLVRTHGKDALVGLIGSYAEGKTDDEAFQAAVGQDVEGFNAAWLADLKARAPARYGPLPAPAGPLPEGWAAGPSPTVPPGVTVVPDAPSAPLPAAGSALIGPVAVVAVLLVLGVAGLAWYAARRRREADA
jgi:peptidase MA superfamily protein